MTPMYTMSKRAPLLRVTQSHAAAKTLYKCGVDADRVSLAKDVGIFGVAVVWGERTGLSSGGRLSLPGVFFFFFFFAGMGGGSRWDGVDDWC